VWREVTLTYCADQLRETLLQNLLRYSISVVFDYRLDDRGSISSRGKNVSCSLYVQTSSDAYPASYPMGTEGSFPEVKGGQVSDADHSPPSSAEVKNEYKLHLLSPLAPT
jgi:hypothetical protein